MFGMRFILLVQNGVALPSNLKGLCRCKYNGVISTKMGVMKLTKAFKEFRQSSDYPCNSVHG